MVDSYSKYKTSELVDSVPQRVITKIIFSQITAGIW